MTSEAGIVEESVPLFVCREGARSCPRCLLVSLGIAVPPDLSRAHDHAEVAYNQDKSRYEGSYAPKSASEDALRPALFRL